MWRLEYCYFGLGSMGKAELVFGWNLMFYRLMLKRAKDIIGF